MKKTIFEPQNFKLMIVQTEKIFSERELQRIAQFLPKLHRLALGCKKIFFGIPQNLGSEIRKNLYKGKLTKYHPALQLYERYTYAPNEDLCETSFDALLLENLLGIQLVFRIDELVTFHFSYLGSEDELQIAKNNFIKELPNDLWSKFSTSTLLSWNEALALLESKSSF